MVVEAVTLGAMASSILGGIACRRLIAWLGRLLSDLAATYVAAQADAVRERERRATIVAAVTVLPSNGWLIDQRPDGTALTILSESQCRTLLPWHSDHRYHLFPCPPTPPNGGGHAA
jgi:hypothetical protein